MKFLAMRTLFLTIILMGCGVAWADKLSLETIALHATERAVKESECFPVDCSGQNGDFQYNQETGCPENVPSKRQYYKDKCDKALALLDKSLDGSGSAKVAMQVATANAQIATAYCTRALLEEE